MSTLRAAAAAVSLTDDAHPGTDPVFVRGYEGQFRATALVIEAETRLCLVSIDALVPPLDMIQAAARRIAASTPIPVENVLICATHTHSGPTTHDSFGATPDPEYKRRMEDGTVQAVQQACAALDDPDGGASATQVELLLGLSQEPTLGRNSRLLLKDGQIGWFSYDEQDVVRPTGPYDPDVPVLAFRRPDGSLAGVLFNHTVHNIGAVTPDVMSPAFSGLARQEIEQRHNTTALFLPGAFGSTHNITYEGSGLPPPELVHRLSAAVEEGLQHARPCLFGPVQVLQRPFAYRQREFDEAQAAADVRRYAERYFGDQSEAHQRVFANMRAQMAATQGQERQTTLTVIRLGEVVLVGIPGEMYARLGLDLRRRSPFRHTFIIGLANEEIGYIPDRQAYEDGGYQTWVGQHCAVAPGTGEAMVEQALAMLEELYRVGRTSTFDTPCHPEEAAEPPTKDLGTQEVLHSAPCGRSVQDDIHLRQLHSNDALALQRFYNTTSPQVRHWFSPFGWNASLQQCQEACDQSARGERIDIVLDNGHAIVGWAFLSRLDQPLAYLGIGLTDAYCGRGLGKVLVQHLVDTAKSRAHEGIELIVMQDNPRARALYERFGFRITEPHTAPDGREFHKMEVRW